MSQHSRGRWCCSTSHRPRGVTKFSHACRNRKKLLLLHFGEELRSLLPEPARSSLARSLAPALPPSLPRSFGFGFARADTVLG